tara:strand:+ start:588 stop:1196 length:609 start_codon:yes stop_codon:yes gene_type:complete
MIKNIIFDWSGTLSDDLLSCHRICMSVFENCGVNSISLDEFKDEFILPYMEFYWKYIPDLKKEVQDRIFSENIDNCSPDLYPEVKETLQFLKNKNVNMIILSSTNQSHIDQEMIKHNLGHFFSEVKASVYDKIKVIPELMIKHNFKPEETVFVGDMVHDILTGKAAGIKTLALTWGYHKRAKLFSANPDYIINNIEELKKII